VLNIKSIQLFLFMITLFFITSTEALAEQQETDNVKINHVLDSLHDAASKAQKERYLALFTKDGVFMGTDDWERWSRPVEFDAYVDKGFKDGVGWTYHPEERHINYAADANTAWFDEITVSPQWGRFRGTGVLIREGESWKIAHYALSFLVPNEAWEKVSELSSKAFDARKE
jgi:hypothetical protein